MKHRISNFHYQHSDEHVRDDFARDLDSFLKEAQRDRYKVDAANNAKTEFLTHMSHEIRNPVNVIVGISTLLAASTPLTERQQELIHTLQLSSDSLMGLLNDFLDITKIEEGEINFEEIPFSLYQTLQDVAHMMSASARSKGLNFNVHCELKPGQIYLGDPMRIRQMLLNLCSNAIKFTNKGSIDISVISRGFAAGSEKIDILISDTGIGIPEEYQKRIFEKFTQANSTISRKYGGTGLGLSITKRLVEAMGGSLTLQSNPGDGSVFTLRFSLIRKGKTSKEEQALSAWASEGGK